MIDLNEQFGHIYDQYIDKIYRFVYLKVNSQEIAEDITSKVFLKGWEAYKAGAENIRNTNAFLYKIANNAVIDHYREKGRTNVVSTEISAQLVQPGKDIQEKAIINADFAIVKTAIQGLKKDYQDIILLHYIEDMPISEIAEILDKPEGTVRVMLHRGLKELRNVIKS